MLGLKVVPVTDTGLRHILSSEGVFGFRRTAATIIAL
jgi:hypothetical protein